MEENSKINKKPRAKKKTVVTFSGNESHAKVISPLTQDGNPVLRLMATGPRSLAEGSLDFADLKNNGVYKDLEKQIIDVGGKIASSVSKNTFVVLVKDLDEKSGKIETAKKLRVDVLSRDDFIGKYI